MELSHTMQTLSDLVSHLGLAKDFQDDRERFVQRPMVSVMDNDTERLKDLRDTLKEAGDSPGKTWLRPDYCKEMAEVLDRTIPNMEPERTAWAWSYFGDIVAPVSAGMPGQDDFF